MPLAFGTYPGGYGQNNFGPAAWWYAQQMKGRPYGGPYAAAGADQAAQGYYADPSNMPSFSDMITGPASDAFKKARLAEGLAGANTAGTAATQSQRDTGIKGSLDTTNAWANAKYGQLSNQMALENLRNSKTNQQFSIFGNLAKPFFGQGGMLMGGGSNPGLIPSTLTGGGSGSGIFSNLGGSTGIMGLLGGMFGGAAPSGVAAGEGAFGGAGAVGGAVDTTGMFASLAEMSPELLVAM